MTVRIGDTSNFVNMDNVLYMKPSHTLMNFTPYIKVHFVNGEQADFFCGSHQASGDAAMKVAIAQIEYTYEMIQIQ